MKNFWLCLFSHCPSLLGQTIVSCWILNLKNKDASRWPESRGFLSKVTLKKCQTGLLPLSFPFFIIPACFHHCLPVSRSVSTSWVPREKAWAHCFPVKTQIWSPSRLVCLSEPGDWWCLRQLKLPGGATDSCSGCLCSGAGGGHGEGDGRSGLRTF